MNKVNSDSDNIQDSRLSLDNSNESFNNSYSCNTSSDKDNSIDNSICPIFFLFNSQSYH